MELPATKNRTNAVRGLLCVLMLALAGAWANPANAIMLAYTPGTPTGTTSSVNDLTIGFAFSPTVNISVDGLGTLDLSPAGLQEAHPIGIWRDSDMALIASATVPSGTAGTLVSGYRFASIVPVELLAGVDYRIGVYRSNGFFDFYSAGPLTTAPEINRASDFAIFPSGGGLTFPSNSTGNQRYVVNFSFFTTTAVPEPATWAIFGIGLSVLVFAGRRRRESD